MLMKALENSGWFTVIEREGLPHLLKEREIVNTMRESYETREGGLLPALPPLLYAGVILEGGIISYDTNVLTGGFGAKYCGLGGDVQYRKDQVTNLLESCIYHDWKSSQIRFNHQNYSFQRSTPWNF